MDGLFLGQVRRPRARGKPPAVPPCNPFPGVHVTHVGSRGWLRRKNANLIPLTFGAIQQGLDLLELHLFARNICARQCTTVCSPCLLAPDGPRGLLHQDTNFSCTSFSSRTTPCSCMNAIPGAVDEDPTSHEIGPSQILAMQQSPEGCLDGSAPWSSVLQGEEEQRGHTGVWPAKSGVRIAGPQECPASARHSGIGLHQPARHVQCRAASAGYQPTEETLAAPPRAP